MRYVGRAGANAVEHGKFGNPITVAHILEQGLTADPAAARHLSVLEFAAWLDGADWSRGFEPERRRRLLDALPELAGRQLACWCAPPEPGEPDWCHGAVLLRRANRPPDVPAVHPRPLRPTRSAGRRPDRGTPR